MNVFEETVKKYIIEKGFQVELAVEYYNNSYTFKEDFWDPIGVNVIYDHFNNCELVIPELEKLTLSKSLYILSLALSMIQTKTFCLELLVKKITIFTANVVNMISFLSLLMIV